MLLFKSVPKPEFQKYINFALGSHTKEIKKYSTEPKDLNAQQQTTNIANQLLPNGMYTTGHYFYYIYLNSTKIGIIWYQITDTETVLICQFIIFPEFRRQGFGQQSLSKLEELLMETKITKIILTVFKQNHAAINLYLKHRYTI